MERPSSGHTERGCAEPGVLCFYPEWGKRSLENLGGRKGDQCGFNPFISQSFCCSTKETGKGKECEQFQQFAFQKGSDIG